MLPTPHPFHSSPFGPPRVRMSTRVLVVTRNAALIDKLKHSVLNANGDTPTIPYASRLAEATSRLKAPDDIQALILDWDLPGAHGFEALLALMNVAPQLPLVVLGNDRDLAQQMNLVQHGAEDYLLHSRIDAETLLNKVHKSIARKAREGVLFDNKERAQVTLNSIGDAVLSTDRAWRVTFLNPMAEKLLAWTYTEAAGRHLSEVFPVIDATTRELLVPQLEMEIGNGHTIILPPNCVLVRRDAKELSIEDSAAPIRDQNGNISGAVIVFRDVSASRAMSERMAHLAEHDILTSLPNRALLDDRLDQGIALAKRHGRRLAVLFVDLDHFKHINDSLGHLIGDQLLKAVAERITPCIRTSDTVSRQGGDEFIVLLSELVKAEDAGLIAEKIRLAVIAPYSIANHHLHLSASIGVSVYPEDGADSESLIRSADTAMYHAKERGRNNSQFFRKEMNVHAVERQSITSDLRLALARGEFILEYQPKINLLTGAIAGVEALIRWPDPARGLLYPVQFIPIAEDCGLIIPIGRWALREACAQAQSWLAKDLKFGTMAVNISAVEFRSDRFFDGVCSILESTGLPPQYLELELTETAVMRNFESTGLVLQALSAMRVRIAVDDFGTGYSNLSYLKRFPINSLKLDKSFVHDIAHSPNVATIVRSVIRMGQNLNLQVVAEGIENEQQLKFLRAQECSEGQGHYFSKSLLAGECEALLRARALHWTWQFRAPALQQNK